MSGKLVRSASATRAGSAHHHRSVFGPLSARLKRRLTGQDDQSGFTLMETIVSITLLGILMTASTAFFISANRSTSDLRHKQAATQLAVDALEQVNSLDAAKLIIGRDQSSVTTQWTAATSAASLTNPWSAVGAWLANTNPVYDLSAAANSGATCATNNLLGGNAPLCIPAAPALPWPVINGITYMVNTYIGQCWKTVSTADNSCVNTPPTTGGPALIPFYRVVAAVSWQGKSCPLGGCVYIASNLQNATGADPIFNVNQAAAPTPAPIIVNPGAQAGTVTSNNVFLQLSGSGGSGTYTWAANGLPTGLSMTANTITGTLPSSPGSYTTTVTMTDSANTATTTSFTWTVNGAPTITAPTAAQLSMTVGQADTFPFTGAGGTTPYTWSVTGALPPGISFANGVLSGTPTTAGSYPITEKLTDKSVYSPAPTRAVTITVNAAPTLPTQAARSSVLNTAISPVTVTVTGGGAPLAWTLSGVPGLSISSSGVISGAATSTGVQTASVSVTDANGATSSTSFTWTVTAPLTVTNPGSLVSWPTDAVLLNLASTGGTAPVTWSATGLPSGLSVSGATIVGTPALSAAGSNPSVGTAYPITITATDTRGATSSTSFTWTIKLRYGSIRNLQGGCANDAGANVPPAASTVISYSCESAPNSQWTILTNKTIQNALSNGAFCLSANGSTVNSTISLAACNASLPAQQWTRTVNGTVLNLVNQGLCLAVTGSPTYSNLTLQVCAADAQRGWTLPS